MIRIPNVIVTDPIGLSKPAAHKYIKKKKKTIFFSNLCKVWKSPTLPDAPSKKKKKTAQNIELTFITVSAIDFAQRFHAAWLFSQTQMQVLPLRGEKTNCSGKWYLDMIIISSLPMVYQILY